MKKSGEMCVVCGKATRYTIEQSVHEREFYVDGAGQLCRECFQRIYGKNLQMDFTKKYSDAFYQVYIDNFQTNKKNRLLVLLGLTVLHMQAMKNKCRFYVKIPVSISIKKIFAIMKRLTVFF